MNDYTRGYIFELYSGNEVFSAEQQAMMDCINAHIEAKQFKQLEYYLQQTQGIEQMLIDQVMMDPTDKSRWDWLIGYELIDTIEDFERVNRFALTAYTYHPDDPFYYALALYWMGWNDFVITDEDVVLAETLIERGPEEVSGLLCIALARRDVNHFDYTYVQRAIERCPWAVEPYMKLGEHRMRTNPKEGKMLIKQGLDRVKYKWGFDQKGRWFNTGSQYFNPSTWRQDTITELLGLSMSRDEYKKYERMINKK
ncbi:hypothetical protein [Exiguobacterium sp.]|uniref:hypothetical protein n=1 Tax=Exiguobacterium sp. TaxID=44751 RepID=UPI00263BD4A6|nr:hypothetical protein [Exiguobacterium sp.]MCC5892027.1 hypothetical protein [Exiguobacterium sp.]